MRTLEEFKKMCERFVMANLELAISKTDDGYSIAVHDVVRGDLVSMSGEVIDKDYECVTQPVKFYTDENGFIVFIEHAYGAFTKANVEEVRYVLGFIGDSLVTEELEQNVA